MAKVKKGSKKKGRGTKKLNNFFVEKRYWLIR